MKRLIAILLSLFAVGCVVYSDHPITPEDKTAFDSLLFGTWFWNEKDEKGFLHFGIEEKSGLLHVMVVDLDKDGTQKVSEYLGHTSDLKGNKYLNLKQLRPDNKRKGYLFVKYRIKKNVLTISIIDNSTVEEAIKKGSLKGVVDDEKSITRITEEQKKLQNFILKNDKKLFDEETSINRLSIPMMK